MSPRDLGPVFSWGAVGTGIGSICMGLLADIWGRKKIIIASVAVFGLLSLCTVLVTSIDQLLILRPLTGFGLGAALPLTFVMANEFAPARIRARMVAAMACGFAIGAASGGLLQAEMVPYFGWQGIFFIGGARAPRAGGCARAVSAGVRTLSRGARRQVGRDQPHPEADGSEAQFPAGHGVRSSRGTEKEGIEAEPNFLRMAGQRPRSCCRSLIW